MNPIVVMVTMVKLVETLYLDVNNPPPEIANWLNGKHLKKGTRNTYLHDIKTFCNFIQKTPKQILDDYKKEQFSIPDMTERSIFQDIPNYNYYMSEEKKFAPKTIAKKSSALKSLLDSNYIMPPRSLVVKAADPLPENDDIFLTREQIIEMLDFSKHPRNKAIILLMATSGMGSGEIRTLKGKNIDFRGQGHARINHVRYKTGNKYYTFISPEAVKALKEYWKHREKIRGKPLTQNDLAFVVLDTEADKERPITDRRLAKIFRRIGENIGYEPESPKEFIKTRSHAVRKFFSNTLDDLGVNEGDIDWLLGHKQSKLKKTYLGKKKEERMENLYLEHLPHLSFFDEIHIEMPDTERIDALENELSETKNVITKLTEMYSNDIKAIAENRETYKNEIEDRLMEQLLRNGNLLEDPSNIIIEDKTDMKEIQKMVEMLKNKQSLAV